jgi:tRNA U54 and U55 pseudouridine synthase Pus10
MDEFEEAVELLRVAMLGADEVEALVAVRLLRSLLHDECDGRAFNARAKGVTWEQIGRALGMTRQAAHQQFGTDA